MRTDDSPAPVEPRAPTRGEHQEIPAERDTAGDDAAAEAGKDYLPVADWLVQRESACAQERDVIDRQLGELQENQAEVAEADDETRVTQAYSRLKILMLASCDPASTPGLLKNALDNTAEHDHWPPEYKALFHLLESQRRAYALMETKYRELSKRHQKTIEGIGNIEQSLESQLKHQDY